MNDHLWRFLIAKNYSFFFLLTLHVYGAAITENGDWGWKTEDKCFWEKKLKKNNNIKTGKMIKSALRVLISFQVFICKHFKAGKIVFLVSSLSSILDLVSQ